MAIRRQCECGKTFSTRASGCQWQCPDCSGETAAKKAEEDRWKALSVDERIEELKKRLDDVSRRQSWDGKLG